MKKFKLILTFIFFSFILMGQDFNWFEYQANLSGGLEIIYVTDNNHLIGTVPQPRQFLYSKDNGQTWGELCTDIFFFRDTWIENETGVYYSDWQNIFEINFDNGECNLVYEHPSSNAFRDYHIKENGDLWMYGKDLIKATNNGMTLDTLELESFSYSAKRKLHCQDGYPSYITYQKSNQSPYYLREIANDFLSIGSEIELPNSFEGLYHYYNGRLYTSSSYSEDGGLTWVSLNVPVPETDLLKTCFEKDNIYFITDQALYYTNNAGASFDQQNLDFELIGSVHFQAGSNYINLSTRNCQKNIVTSSIDLGENWESFQTDLNLPYSFNVAANTRGELISNSCGIQTWLPSENNWINFNPADYYNNGEDVIALPNDDLFFAGYNNYCLSQNGGTSWDCEEFQFFEFETGLRQKENGVYMGNFNRTIISHNNAQDFSLNEHDFTLFENFDFFSSDKVIYWEFWEDELILYDYLTNEYTDLNKSLNNLFLSMVTSWSGTTVYILEFTNGFKTELQLLTSQDEGRNFEISELDLPLKDTYYSLETDHNGNVFIYSESQVFISQDNGLSWTEISPEHNDLISIQNISISFDNFIYIATSGTGILKSECPINIALNMDCFISGTDADGDQYDDTVDCDDNNPDINPGATEIPYNGLDDDCNIATVDDDLDQDGFSIADDCDDNNSSIFPGQAEVVYNGLDDDCNAETLDDDLDQDGYLISEDCDDTLEDVNPGEMEIANNEVDEDCDGTILIIDSDMDGYNSDEDCDDSSADINPGLMEIPYNGIDDDCNPDSLDDDLDNDGFLMEDDCNDEDPNINPNAEEILNNGVDEDCDGADLTSSLHEFANYSINIFPNPASNIVNIEIDGNLDFLTKLYDLKGKLISTHSNNSILEISNLPQGAYLIEVVDKNNGQRIVERFVKVD